MRKQRFWASAFYFFYFAAMASCFSYLIVYYQSVGIHMKQIGILLTLPTIITIFGNPIWSAIADAFKLHKWMLPLCVFLTIPSLWSLSQSHSFFAIAIFLGLFTLVGSPIISLADYASLNLLGEKRNDYGKLRLWGAIGFGLSSLVVGNLIEIYGIRVIFISFIILMSMNVVVASRLPEPRLVRSEPFWSGIKRLARDQRWYGFLGSLFLVGMAFSVINSFLILFIKNKGAGESLFGLATAIAGVGELPVFFLASLLLSRWDARKLVMASMLFMVVRCFLTSLVVNPYWVLPLQLMHGLTFSLLWSAGVSYANEIAPGGVGASAQALMSVTLYSIGGGVGSMIASQLYDLVGTTILFRLAAISGLLAFLLLFALSGKRTSIRVDMHLD